MRLAKTVALAAVVAALPAQHLRAGEEVVRSEKASDADISAAVARFVTRHHPSASGERPRLNFDKPEILPQDEPGRYAVFGGYMAFASGSQPQPHAYGMTMRSTCPRHSDPECWQLEKLLIDQALVVDR